MRSLEFILLAASSLFAIMDPLGTVPAFLAMTPHDSPRERIRMAKTACIISAGILSAFALAGDFIFRFLGITIPAFQMAGSVVLLLVALDMLRADRSRVKETLEETQAGVKKTDIAVTPLAVPMIAGPGAISTAILLHGRAVNIAQEAALVGCIVAVCGVSFVILALSAQGARWLGPITLRLIERLMGLLLASIAMQFLINALRELKVILP
jgi:multiple antibiotic resistance protein